MEIQTIGIDLGKTGFPWNYLQPLGRTFRYRDDSRLADALMYQLKHKKPLSRRVAATRA
jgi:hypothetical protein